MDKSVFKVTAMDCAAEESLVRMGMDAVPSVQALEFDTSARQVAVYHLGDLKSVVSAMDSGWAHHTFKPRNPTPQQATPAINDVSFGRYC